MWIRLNACKASSTLERGKLFQRGVEARQPEHSPAFRQWQNAGECCSGRLALAPPLKRLASFQTQVVLLIVSIGQCFSRAMKRSSELIQIPQKNDDFDE